MIELAMKRSSRTGVLWSSLLLAGAMLAAVALVSHRPLTRDWALASAAVSGLGTLAVAAYASRWSVYPRWSFVVAGGILGGSLVLTAVLSPDLAQWRKDIAITWMLPYYFLIAVLTGPPRPTGSCAATSRWAPWLAVGTGLFLGMVNLVTSSVGGRW